MPWSANLASIAQFKGAIPGEIEWQHWAGARSPYIRWILSHAEYSSIGAGHYDNLKGRKKANILMQYTQWYSTLQKANGCSVVRKAILQLLKYKMVWKVPVFAWRIFFFFGSPAFFQHFKIRNVYCGKLLMKPSGMVTGGVSAYKFRNWTGIFTRKQGALPTSVN